MKSFRDIAQYVYDNAPRQEQNVAISATIALLAGIVGRAYNINGTGLNQYIMVVGKSGIGKDTALSFISQTIHLLATKYNRPDYYNFRGPANFASDKALVTFLQRPKGQCFVSTLSEIGVKIRNMATHKATVHQSALFGLLLELYSKSGYKDCISSYVYADSSKNIAPIASPAVTIYGETTLNQLTADTNMTTLFDSGFLSRFLIIPCDDKISYLNPKLNSLPFPQEALDKLNTLADLALAAYDHSYLNVSLSEEASNFVFAYDKQTTDRANSSKDELERRMLNRAGLKMLKLAALMSVYDNPLYPCIQLSDVVWAQSLLDGYANKFMRMVLRTDEEEQKKIEIMLKYVKEYFENSNNYKKYDVDRSNGLIPYSYLNERAGMNKHTKGMTTALIARLEELGHIATDTTAKNKYRRLD